MVTVKWAFCGGELVSMLKVLCVTVLLLIAGLSPASPQSPQPAGTDRQDAGLTENRWVKDLDFLAEELPKRHKNLFFSISPQEFLSRIEELRTDIPDLEDYEIVVRMMSLVASIGDSHTKLGAEYSGLLSRLPVRAEWFSDGLYIKETISGYEDILGRRILTIEDTSAEDLRDAVSKVIPHENSAQIDRRSPLYMIIPEILVSLGLAESLEIVRLGIESLGSIPVSAVPLTADLEWITVVDSLTCSPPLYLQHPDSNYWFRFLDDHGTVYAQYRSCSEMKGRPFASFADDLLSFIDSRPVAKFVFDMRDNGGGNSAIAKPLIDAVKARGAINRKGHLFVVIGRETFSSAVLNALEFRRKTDAIFVGAATGGKPSHYGEVKFFNLPESGIIVTYSTKYFAHSDEDTPSLYPDLTVDMAFSDLLSCRDPVLEAILASE
jgi:hypothetical protein